MKKGIVALMIIVCLGLGAAVAFLYFSEDSKAPTIQFEEKEITYTQGEDYDKLLEGVTAMDNRDGDVTQSLMIDSIYPNADGTKATVKYVARDKANNIGKRSLVVNYNSINEEEQELSSESIQNSGEDVDISEEGRLENEELEEAEVLETEEEVSTGNPVIKLTQNSITINKGDSVDRISFVKSIKDDKDDENELWRMIQIVGDTFNSNTAGTYKQIYYVVDSDGNKSNEEILTITVQ